ncbi:MAG: DNA-binding response regulator [Phototrophicales bacterium]|nr:MAG: DNA-binding response regulator [Phototrophicales bacterium]
MVLVMSDVIEHRSVSPASISVLIVDDHPLFRDGLQQAVEIEDDLVVVGQCATGADALRQAAELQPDVMLLDINLPDLNGLQIMRQLKNEYSEISIIVLTAYHDSEQVLHAMRAGASAYCPKDITQEQLVGIIRDVAQGLYVVNDQQMDRAALLNWISSSIDAIGGYTASSDETYVPLSPREMEILQFVTHGMSNKEIAHRLRISQQTVKNHMTSILKKLNVQDRTQAAVTALRHGWVRLQDITRHP